MLAIKIVLTSNGIQILSFASLGLVGIVCAVLRLRTTSPKATCERARVLQKEREAQHRRSGLENNRSERANLWDSKGGNKLIAAAWPRQLQNIANTVGEITYEQAVQEERKNLRVSEWMNVL